MAKLAGVPISGVEQTVAPAALWKEPIPEPEAKVVSVGLSVVERTRWWRELSDVRASEDVFGYRTKKDLSIRRLRLEDIRRLMHARGYVGWGVYVLSTGVGGWDVVAVTNVLLACWLEGLDWFKWWQQTGAWDGGITNFSEVAKRVNVVAKGVGVTGKPRWDIAESAGLVGYRNPPFPGFDVVVETKALAAGGELHHWSRAEFSAKARELFLARVMPPEDQTSLLTYVQFGDWATSGSSSVGRVNWQAGEEEGHFKARKNMVPDVVDWKEVAAKLADFTPQENTTLIKSELGKLRLAVAGDIFTYWRQAWISSIMGRVYESWDGSTSGERGLRLLERIERMTEWARFGWGMPYDYQAFDHQPTLWEMVVLADTLCELAQKSAGSEDIYREVLEQREKIRYGFEHATLKTRKNLAGDNPEVVVPVTGGLNSGLFWTARVGDMWNMVVSALAKSDAEELIGAGHYGERFIKGDDAAFSAEDPFDLLLLKMMMDRRGAKAGVGKFGVHKAESEFLRVWMAEGRARGFRMRAIPTMTQRKPWSTDPWEEEGNLRALYQAGGTYVRRGGDVSQWGELWDSELKRWAERRGVKAEVVSVPRLLGGLGLGVWDGHTTATRGTDAGRPVHMLITSTWSRERVNNQVVEALGDGPWQAGVQGVTQAKADAKLRLDDVPKVTRLLREQTQDWVVRGVSFRPRWNVQACGRLADMCRLVRACTTTRDLGALLLLEVGGAQYGSRVSQKREFDMVRELARYAEFEVPEWYSGVLRDRSRLEQKGMGRALAEGWLFADLPAVEVFALHPEATKYLMKAVAQVFEGWVRRARMPKQGWAAVLTHIQTQIALAFTQSRAYQRMLSW